MYCKLYSSFLLDKGHISAEQYRLIFKELCSVRVKMGLIAVEMSFMTKEQADEVNRLQAVKDKRFGDIAVEKGYLTEEQVGQLLKLQGNPYMQFTQILVENDILSPEMNTEYLKEYQEENGFTDDELEIIKSGNVDLIVPILVKIEAPWYTYHTGLVIRNLIRFVSTDVSITGVERVKQYTSRHFAYQYMEGDRLVYMGFAGEGNSLLVIAENFGKEEFNGINDDAYDSICEFINCINGLLASQLDKESIDIDIQPPLFADNVDISVDDEGFYVVTVDISGNAVDIVLAIDTALSLR